MPIIGHVHDPATPNLAWRIIAETRDGLLHCLLVRHDRALRAHPNTCRFPYVHEAIENCPPRGSFLRQQIGKHESRRNAIFVPNRPADCVPEGLLVSEDELAHTLRFQGQASINDPFEPGQGHFMVGSSMGRDLRENGAGDD